MLSTTLGLVFDSMIPSSLILLMMRLTLSSRVRRSVLTSMSGVAGASYGSEIPVKFLISPALAFL